MQKTVVSTDKAPAAIGPYSQAIKVGDFFFVSGQLPVDPASGQIVAGGVKEQADKTLANLQAVLAAGGANMGDVVKTTVYVKDMADFSVINETYSKYFKSSPPARSCVEVASLPKGAMVEIEAIAILDK